MFHDTRMEWMRSDESGWLAESGFYPRVVDGERLRHPSGALSRWTVGYMTPGVMDAQA